MPRFTIRAALLACALGLGLLLTACGGGDDSDPHTCYVDGKAMPKEACR